MKKNLKSRITQVIISSGLLVYIILKFEIDIAEIINKIKRIEFILLALLLALLVRPLVATRRWQIYLKYAGIKESLFQLIKIRWTSTFLAFFISLNFGSDVIRMYLLEKKHPEKTGFSGASVVAEKMFGFILFCLLGTIGSFFLSYSREMLKVRLIIFSLTILAVLITFSVINDKVYIIVSRTLKKIPFLKFFFQYVTSLHRAITILPYGKILPRTFPFILTFQLINIFMIYLIFRSFDIEISFFSHLGLVPVIQIIAMVPLTIAGLGVREGVFIYFYNLLSVEGDISFSVSILNFLMLAGISALIGGTIVLFSKLFTRESFFKRQEGN